MTDQEQIPISSLLHWRVCPRRCALLLIAGVWDDNRLTVEGRLMHERVHEAGDEIRGGVRTVRGLELISKRLGLIGQADAVEFRQGAPPFPVEYKHGRPQKDTSNALQLCAQALCLEEMLGVTIPAGALFYGATRRRQDIPFTPQLRAEVETAVAAIRDLLAQGQIPPPSPTDRCRGCSLAPHCKTYPPVADYLRQALTEDTPQNPKGAEPKP